MGGRLINVYAHLPYFIALCLAKTETQPKTEGDIVWGANNEWDDAAHGVLKLHYVYVAYQHQHLQAGTVNADVNSLLHATNNNNTDANTNTQTAREREAGIEQERTPVCCLKYAKKSCTQKTQEPSWESHLCINNERTHACTHSHTHVRTHTAILSLKASV